MLSKAYIVPHPPIILPEIGGTGAGYSEYSECLSHDCDDIASAKPQTIVVFSPHAQAIGDYIQISDGAQAFGSFEAFGVKDVDMKVLYDEDFVDMLCHAAASQGLPAGTLGEQSQTGWIMEPWCRCILFTGIHRFSACAYFSQRTGS
ncbi:MAG: hypothetical protein ACLTJG_01830 [[Clostridium] innocuum]